MRRVITRWDPWRQFNQLQREVNELFSTRWPAGILERREFPPVNVWQSEDGLAVTAELPGVDAEHLDITINAGTVTIRGQREEQTGDEGDKHSRRERSAGSFSRTIGLPYEVDPGQAEATYEKGILTLALRRPEEHKPKKLKVKAG